MKTLFFLAVFPLRGAQEQNLPSALIPTQMGAASPLKGTSHRPYTPQTPWESRRKDLHPLESVYEKSLILQETGE